MEYTGNNWAQHSGEVSLNPLKQSCFVQNTLHKLKFASRERFVGTISNLFMRLKVSLVSKADVMR